MSSYSPPPVALIHDLVPKDAEGNPLPIKRKPGRPRKQITPSIHEIELAAIINRQRDAHVENDGLVRSIESKAPSIDIIRTALMELAHESAAIKYEIRSAQAASKSDGIPQKMGRRLAALSAMSTVLLESHRLKLVELDLESERVQRVFEFFVETVAGVAHQTLPNAVEFVDRCEQALDGWEDRVE